MLGRSGRLVMGLILVPLYPLWLLPQVKGVVRAALFVTQVLPLPFTPQKWFAAEPIREAVSFPLAEATGSADVYRIPGGRKRAGVLVFLGIIAAPRDDHRVVNLGTALARAGFVAMFAWSPSMMGKRIEPDEPDNLVRAFQHLMSLDYVDPGRVGMGGFCVGASMLTIAASDPRINERVSFVSSFGAYYDMGDTIKQICSNRSFYGRAVDPWDPNHLTEEVMTIHLIGGLEDAAERDALTRMFIGEDGSHAQEPEGLSGEGRMVYRLLSSTAGPDAGRLSLEEADRLVRDLSTSFQDGLRRISPSAGVANLKARVLIAHDREDNLVPSEESRRLANALRERGGFRHTEFSFFSHVTPGKRVGAVTFVKEAFKLFRYTYSIIKVTA